MLFHPVNWCLKVCVRVAFCLAWAKDEGEYINVGVLEKQQVICTKRFSYRKEILDNPSLLLVRGCAENWSCNSSPHGGRRWAASITKPNKGHAIGKARSNISWCFWTYPYTVHSFREYYGTKSCRVGNSSEEKPSLKGPESCSID